MAIHQSMLSAFKDKVWTDPTLSRMFPRGSWVGDPHPSGVAPDPLIQMKSVGSTETSETFENVWLEVGRIEIKVKARKKIPDQIIAAVKNAFDWSTLDQLPGMQYGLDTSEGQTVYIKPLSEPNVITQEERGADQQVLHEITFEYESMIRRTRPA
jgi:hypothetical protein